MVTYNLALARIIDKEPRFTVRLGVELNTAMDPYHLIDATFEVVSSVPCLKKVRLGPDDWMDMETLHREQIATKVNVVQHYTSDTSSA